MRALLTGTVKLATRIGTKATGFLPKKLAANVNRLGKNLLKNAQTRKWWGKTARQIRRTGVLNTSSAGEEAKKSGPDNWSNKGGNIFSGKSKSPKELKEDFDRKQDTLSRLRESAEVERARAAASQSYISIQPVNISSIPEVGDKVNVLSGSIDKMRSDVASIKEIQSQESNTNKKFRESQAQSNVHLGEVVLTTSEGTTKVVMAGFEDASLQSRGLHQQTTESIVGEVTTKMDELDEENRKERELEKKNSWIKKFLDKLLFVVELIFDLPHKIFMLLLTVGLMLTLAIGALIMGNWNKIKAFFSASTSDMTSYLMTRMKKSSMMFGQFLAYLTKGMAWLMKTFSFGKAVKLASQVAMNNADMKAKKFGDLADGIEEIAEGKMKSMLSDYSEMKAKNDAIKNNTESSLSSLDPNNPSKFNVDVGKATSVGVDTATTSKSTKLEKNNGEDTAITFVDEDETAKQNKTMAETAGGLAHTLATEGVSGAIGYITKEVLARTSFGDKKEEKPKGAVSQPKVETSVPNTTNTTPHLGEVKIGQDATIGSSFSGTFSPVITVASSSEKEGDKELSILNSKLDVIDTNIKAVNKNLVTSTELTIKAANSRTPTVTKIDNKWKSVSNNNKSELI